MEKTSILDFISKLTGTTPNSADEEKKGSNDPAEQSPKNSVKDNNESSQKSFMKSYNPFASADSDKRQISSPRAAKPPKSTIDLKNGKNLASEKKSDGSSDMVRFINRHNALSKQIGIKKEEQ